MVVILKNFYKKNINILNQIFQMYKKTIFIMKLKQAFVIINR